MDDSLVTVCTESLFVLSVSYNALFIEPKSHICHCISTSIKGLEILSPRHEILLFAYAFATKLRLILFIIGVVTLTFESNHFIAV